MLARAEARQRTCGNAIDAHAIEMHEMKLSMQVASVGGMVRVRMSDGVHPLVLLLDPLALRHAGDGQGAGAAEPVALVGANPLGLHAVRDHPVEHGADGGGQDGGAHDGDGHGQPPLGAAHHHERQRQEGDADEHAGHPHELVDHRHHLLLGLALDHHHRRLHHHHGQRDEERHRVEDEEDDERRLVGDVGLPDVLPGRQAAAGVLNVLPGHREDARERHRRDQHGHHRRRVDGVVQPFLVQLVDALRDALHPHPGLPRLLQLRVHLVLDVAHLLLQLALLLVVPAAGARADGARRLHAVLRQQLSRVAVAHLLRRVQRGLAGPVDRLEVRVGHRDQPPDDLVPRLARRDVQRGVALVVLLVQQRRLGGEERVDEVQPGGLGGHVQRGLALLVRAQRDAGLRLQQRAHHLHVPVPRRRVQRRLAVAARDQRQAPVHLQQEPHHVQVSLRRRRVQRRRVRRVHRQRQLRQRLQQLPHDVCTVECNDGGTWMAIMHACICMRMRKKLMKNQPINTYIPLLGGDVERVVAAAGLDAGGGDVVAPDHLPHQGHVPVLGGHEQRRLPGLVLPR